MNIYRTSRPELNYNMNINTGKYNLALFFWKTKPQLKDRNLTQMQNTNCLTHTQKENINKQLGIHNNIPNFCTIISVYLAW